MESNKIKSNFRKRKLDSDFIYEVCDDDFSPPNTPEENETKIEEKIEKIKNEEINIIEDCLEEKRAILNCPETNKVLILSEKNVKSEISEVIKLAGNSNNIENITNDKFLFSIKFRDKNFADLYRKNIISAIMGCTKLNLREEIDDLGLKIKFWESKTSSDMEITSDSSENDEITFENLFVVDPTPSNKVPTAQPKFYSCTKYVIPDNNDIPEESIEDLKKKMNKPKRNLNPNVCFNCEGSHALKDCKEPRNHKKINAARNRHKEMKSAKHMRYHLEDDQKYGHLVPGKLSSKLRDALGLEENEIPPYIYHMRRLGYPLGWLEASKQTESSLELYDFSGKNENGNDNEKNQIDNCEYDLSKVIEYPGFNAPLPKGAKDLHYRYKCPPYNEKHSLKYMLEFLKTQKKDPKKSSDENQTGSKTTQISDEAKNDEKNSVSAEKIDDSSRNSSENSRDENIRSKSPTLTDLEMEKQKLLDILNNGISLETPESDRKTKITLEQLEIETPPSIVKSSSLGTPILKNFSPYQKLPNPDNFSVGVSQVINFENLPDSTGKYEQMTNVLDKVRKTIRFSNSNSGTPTAEMKTETETAETTLPENDVKIHLET